MRRLVLLALVLLASPAWAARTIRYVGGQVGGFAGTTSNQTITFALTNGMASQPEAGDFVLVSYCTGSTADRTLTITNTGATAYTYLSDLYANDTYDANMRVGYRFMPATPETQLILSQTFDIADAGRYTIHVFRGVDDTTPIDVTSTTITGIDSRVVNPAAITPSTAGAWIWITGCGAGGTGGTYTASHLSDFRAGTTADTNDAFIGSGWYRGWTSGAYDGANFAAGGTSTTSDSWASTSVALRPATLTSAIKPTGSTVSAVASPATSVALAMPTGEDVTSGNVVVIGCVRDSTASNDPFVVGDIAKTAGTATVGSFQLDAVVSAVQSGGTNYHTSGIFSVKVTGTGTLTITVSDDGSQYFFCAAQEYSGMDGTTWLAGTSTGSGTTGAPTTSTYAGTDEMLFVGMVGTQTTVATTHTKGLDFITVAESENGAANMTGSMTERLVSTTTTDAADWVAPTTVYWVATLAAYQDTVGAGPTCAQSIALMGVGCR